MARLAGWRNVRLRQQRDALEGDVRRAREARDEAWRQLDVAEEALRAFDAAQTECDPAGAAQALIARTPRPYDGNKKVGVSTRDT